MTQNTSPMQVLYPESVPGLRKLWTYTTTVVNGVVYVGSNDHSLYAFNHLAIASAITVVL